MPFQIYGLYSSTPWATHSDIPAPGNLGKVSMPSAAPGNRMLVCYSPGPAHLSGRPTPYIKSEVRIMNVKLAASPADLELVKSNPAYNYLQPLAAVSYQTIYGSLPPVIEECPDSTHPMLPKGTPFGLIGTSSVWDPESWAANGSYQNFVGQGSNATVARCEVSARLNRQDADSPPSAYQSDRGIRHFPATGRERMQVVGEVNVRKAGRSRGFCRPSRYEFP